MRRRQMTIPVALAVLALAASARAMVTCDLAREATIEGGDVLAAAVADVLASDGEVRLGRSDVLDAAADAASLLGPASPFFAEPATRPTPATGELACFLLADRLLDRPAVRIVVVDRRRLLRLHVERLILQDEPGFNAQAVADAVRRAAEKSREPALAHVVVTPTIVVDVDRASAPPARFVPERIEAELLSRPGIFVVESELARRVLPAPATNAPPHAWPGDGPWVVASEYEPIRRPLGEPASRPAGEENVPRAAMSIAPPPAVDATWPGPGVLRVTVTRGDATPRPTSADVAGPDAIPTAAARLARTITLDPAAPPAGGASPIVAAAERLMAAGEFADAAAFYELAVSREPSSFALRAAVMAAHLRTNRPHDGPGVGRFFDAGLRIPAGDSPDATVDRIAGIHFRAMAHLKATVDAPRPAEPRMAGPGDDPIVRMLFTPLLSWPGESIPGNRGGPAVMPQVQRYRDVLRAAWTEWADRRVEAGETDEAMYLRAAHALLQPPEQRDAIIAFATRHADAPDLATRLLVWADTMGRERTPEMLARMPPDFAARVPPAIAPRPMLLGFFAALESSDDLRLIAAAREARKLDLDRMNALRAASTTRAGTRPATTRAAVAATMPADFDDAAPPELTFTAIKRPAWTGPLVADGRDVVWSGQTISLLADDGALTPLLENVVPPADNAPIGRAVFDGRYLWATLRTGRHASASPALIVLDPKTRQHRVIGAGDGLPPTNGAAAGRTTANPAIAPLGPGEVAIAGASDRAWVAVVRVDASLRPSVDVIARLDREALTPASMEDPLANVVPESLHAVAPDAAGRPTQLLVGRRSGAASAGPFASPSQIRTLLVTLADRSLAVIRTPSLSSADRAVTVDGRLYCVTTNARLDRGPTQAELRRYEPITRTFETVATFDGYSNGVALPLGDRFAVGTGDALWVADRPEGPYRRMNRPLPTPANGWTDSRLRGSADGRLLVRWNDQAWWTTVAR